MQRPVIPDSLDRQRLAVFATWCAVHLRELLLEFVPKERHAQLDLWLSDLAALIATGDDEAALKLKSSIELAPEASCDDSNSPAYYAMRALSVAAYAAEVWIATDPVETRSNRP